MGTGGPFPGAKRGWGVTLTTHPHLVPRSRMNRSYTSSPPSTTVDCFALRNKCQSLPSDTFSVATRTVGNLILRNWILLTTDPTDHGPKHHSLSSGTGQRCTWCLARYGWQSFKRFVARTRGLTSGSCVRETGRSSDG
jgi:hypothetical protein